jgi:hypothetical protein
VALTRGVLHCYLVVGSNTCKIGKYAVTTEGSRRRSNSLVAGAGLSPLEWQQNKLTPAASSRLGKRSAPLTRVRASGLETLSTGVGAGANSVKTGRCQSAGLEAPELDGAASLA